MQTLHLMGQLSIYIQSHSEALENDEEVPVDLDQSGKEEDLVTYKEGLLLGQQGRWWRRLVAAAQW